MVQAAQKVHDAGCQGVSRAQHYDGMWCRRVGKWLQYMGKAYQTWVHEVDLAYYIPGLRHALIWNGLHKHAKAPCEIAYSLAGAKHPCTTRKIPGRMRPSPDSPMSLPREKKISHKEDDGALTRLWRSKVALRIYSR